jgi:hypothetical protein
MDELKELMANYQLIQPAISFVVGDAVGTVTRLTQNYRRKAESNRNFLTESWFPATSMGLSVLITTYGGANPEMYVANFSAATVGDYLAVKLVDRLTDRKSS